jgi:DNA mismatch endonuclease (patch repair protein)
MTDVVDVKTKSRMMTGIRSAGTQPEKLVRSSLHRRGFRFARSSLGLVGKPDIVLPHWKLLVFVHGCFWHLHDCSLSRLPSSNRAFWKKKLIANKLRDELVGEELLELGWRILIVWECTTKSRHARDHLDEVMDEIAIWIRGQSDEQRCIASGTGLTFYKNDHKSN